MAELSTPATVDGLYRFGRRAEERSRGAATRILRVDDGIPARVVRAWEPKMGTATYGRSSPRPTIRGSRESMLIPSHPFPAPTKEKQQ